MCVSAVIFIISFRLKILCWFIANNREVSRYSCCTLHCTNSNIVVLSYTVWKLEWLQGTCSCTISAVGCSALHLEQWS